MKRLVMAGALLVAPATLAAQGMASVEEAVNSITEADVYHRISILADDSMLGRDTPSPELEQVANYIAGQFYSFGLRPMGDAGSYLQRYPLTQKVWDGPNSTLTVNGQSFTLGDDMQLVFSSGTPAGENTAPAVVLSGMPSNPQALAALDLGGKVVFAVVPTENGDFAGRSVRGLAGGLFRVRPAAVVFVSDRNDGNFDGQAANLTRPSISKNWGEARGGLAFLEVRDGSVAGILDAAGFDLAAARANPTAEVAVTDLGFDATLNLSQRVLNRTSAPNVVGYLEGSDPDLKD